MTSYQNVLRFALTTPWAIMPEKLDEITAFLQFKADGGVVPAEILAAAEAATAATRQRAASAEGIAVLQVYGVIAQRMNMMSAFSGGTSTEEIAKWLRQAMASPSVSAIVLDVDSPGGSVFGVEELAREIRASRGTKPIVAIANSVMASAAYWIASAADQVVASPSAIVGSVGVLAMHADYSQRNETDGVRMTLVTAGKYKGEGGEDFPLTSEAQGHMQSEVNRYYDMFTKAIAAGRRVTAGQVRDGYGQGRAVGAPQALDLGMIDRIETYDQLIDRLSTPQGRGRSIQRGSMAVLDDWDDQVPNLIPAEADPETEPGEQPTLEDPAPDGSVDDALNVAQTARARDLELMGLLIGG